MKQGIYAITQNRPLTADVYELCLSGDTSAITAPGQFVNVKLDGLFLRRPLSICDWGQDSLTILYKVVGKGTAQMAQKREGDVLDLLTGLGNGFDTAKCGEKTLLIGGGAGVPPMYGLAKTLLRNGKTPIALLGFNQSREIFYEDAFRALGIETIVSTVDGSYGVPGFVTDAFPAQYDFFCACGPEPMLKAVYHATTTDGLMSFEERMGCGFGACMGCSCETRYGSKRICKDGPVLEKGEIVW